MSGIAPYDALLLDLDGTVWAGDDAIPHAVENINACAATGTAVAYVTNNASKGPDEVAGKLQAIGLNAAPADVLTSAQAAALLAQRHAEPGANVLVVGADSFKDLVRSAGFNVVDSADDDPAVVLHGHNPDTGWRQLSEAALSIRKGAFYLASNLDSTLPAERGFMVGNGSMVAAVTNATGVVPAAAGKPGRAMFDLAQETLGVNKPLVVGDRLDTDIAGGVAAEMDTLHVLTGVSGPQALIAAPAEQRPTFIAEDMRVLTECADDFSALAPASQGGFTVSFEGEGGGDPVIILGGGNEDSTWLQALRTVLSAAWSLEEPASTAAVKAASPAAEVAIEAWW